MDELSEKRGEARLRVAAASSRFQQARQLLDEHKSNALLHGPLHAGLVEAQRQWTDAAAEYGHALEDYGRALEDERVEHIRRTNLPHVTFPARPVHGQ